MFCKAVIYVPFEKAGHVAFLMSVTQYVCWLVVMPVSHNLLSGELENALPVKLQTYYLHFFL